MRITLLIVGTVAALLCAAVYALFHGYFDHGQFEIKQAQWSSSIQVAMLAERSDQRALSSYTYFVLVGDHFFSPTELRHAYHSDAVVFAAASTCLTLHWESPSRLVVACNGPYLNQVHIDVEKRQNGGLTISYVNISPSTAQTFRPK